MKTVYEKFETDYETGELKKKVSIKSHKVNEKFIMIRTTDGLKWLSKLKGSEYSLLTLLTAIIDYDKDIVKLTPSERKEIIEILGITYTSLSDMLKKLEDKRFLIRLNKSELKLNPLYSYRCSSNTIPSKIAEFNSIYEKNRGKKSLND